MYAMYPKLLGQRRLEALEVKISPQINRHVFAPVLGGKLPPKTTSK